MVPFYFASELVQLYALITKIKRQIAKNEFFFIHELC